MILYILVSVKLKHKFKINAIDYNVSSKYSNVVVQVQESNDYIKCKVQYVKFAKFATEGSYYIFIQH